MTMQTTLSAAVQASVLVAQALLLALRHEGPVRSCIAKARSIPTKSPQLLIANARLEFPPTPTKQSIDTEPNRKYIAILQFAPRPLRHAASHEVSSSLLEGRGLIPSINRLEFRPLPLVHPEPRRALPHPRNFLCGAGPTERPQRIAG
jgi:hypothetical protein